MSALAPANGCFVPQIWTAWLRVRNRAPPVLAGLLTSNTRSFQTGVPSFDMGAEGADKPLEAMSSFSLGSTESFRLRIFLIETTETGLVSGRANGAMAIVSGAYQFACRAENSPAPPWLAFNNNNNCLSGLHSGAVVGYPRTRKLRRCGCGSDAVVGHWFLDYSGSRMTV